MITLFNLYLSGRFGDKLSEMFQQIGQGNLQPMLMLAVDALLIAAAAVLLCRRESRRKFLVALKRKPQNIPLCVLTLAFVEYSMNLTAISNTTSYVQGPNMGLTGFVTMLLSVLLLVCCLNAFPYRKKTNVFMLTALFVMIAAVLYCDAYYLGLIQTALTREQNPISITETTAYIDTARRVVRCHIVLLALGAFLTATLPVYRRWLKRINTSVEVEDNGDMAEIDIRGEND